MCFKLVRLDGGYRRLIQGLYWGIKGSGLVFRKPNIKESNGTNIETEVGTGGYGGSLSTDIYRKGHCEGLLL